MRRQASARRRFLPALLLLERFPGGSVYQLPNGKYCAEKTVGWLVDPLPPDAPPGAIPKKHRLKVTKSFERKKDAVEALPGLSLEDRRPRSGTATARKGRRVTLKELYDQSSTEDGAVGADGIISGPHKYDKVKDTYYAEISWEDYVIANSGKKYQFSVGFYGKGYTNSDNKYVFYQFDPKNDWSFDGLKLGTKEDFFAVDDPPEERYDHICVYADGVLVGGIEPDGSEPAPKETTTASSKSSATTTKTTTTTAGGKVTTTSAQTEGEYLPGDANLDTKVTVADAVAILQAVANKDKFALKPQGVKNADVIGDGDGVTANDALAIQMYDAKKYDTLPVKSK